MLISKLILPALALGLLLCAAAALAQQGEPAAQSTSGATAVPGIRLPPSLSLTAMPPYGEAPLTVGFFANGIDPENIGFISYRWNFGDGRVSVLPPLMTYITYDNPGTYVVTLTAVTADGRSVSAFTGITVRGRGLSESSPQRR